MPNSEIKPHVEWRIQVQEPGFISEKWFFLEGEWKTKEGAVRRLETELDRKPWMEERKIRFVKCTTTYEPEPTFKAKKVVSYEPCGSTE